jgi:hypothetical protein
MKRLSEFLLVSSLLLGGTGMVAAQEKSAAETPPPKVLTIFREFVKPGKQGMTHEKSEHAFVQAMKAAKWPTHYLAVDSVSGKPRSLFLTAYDSFEAWEKDVQATEKNETLAAALDRAAVADGELLSDADAGAFVYHDEYSLRAATDIAHMRYFEISVFHLRPGHEKDWENLVKMYVAGYEKIPDVHWATYEGIYGSPSDTYLVFSPMKSAAEIDRGFGQGKQFEAALGEEGMKKLNELTAAALESSQTNLFTFNPRMSYVRDEWVKADPDFWAPKPAHAAAASKKPAEKPSTKQ